MRDVEERRQDQETSEARPLEKLLVVGTKQTKERKLALLECSDSFRTILLFKFTHQPLEAFSF